MAVVLTGVNGWAGEAEKEAAAIKAAESWLGLVDAGKYAESWTEAATYFRNAVPQAQWEQSLGAVRAPLGALVSRAVSNAAYRTTLPGAPDGEYVLIQFSTSFSNKTTAIERVTPMMDTDGVWRVSGYYIK
jgi:hypothetical protein